MNDIVNTPSRIHPLVATAAIAITLVSLVGIAAITGLLPISNSSVGPQQAMADASMTLQQQAALQAQNNIPPVQPAPTKPNYAVQPQHSNGYSNSSPAPAVAHCSNCGEVLAVRAVQHTPKASGVGVIAGAVLGGILGNQVGNGNGRALATVAGAGAGGFAGNEVEKRSRTTTSYVVDVRMENGSVRSFPQTGEGWHVGDQVRVVDGHLSADG